MLQIQVGNTVLNFGLLVIDMQNGFVGKGGSYDKLGMNIKNYRKALHNSGLDSLLQARSYSHILYSSSS